VRRVLTFFAIALILVAGVAVAQDEDQDTAQGQEQPEEEAEQADADETVSDVIFVTGSRIAANPLYQRAPLVEVDELEIKRSGLTNLGTALQQIPSMGTAINSRFNVPGNSGFPQDGNGIGAGAVQLSLRNVGAKRTLVLVDGKRWIAGASASGVSNSVDLNTLPANVIQRVEVLQDGASAIYGSDAIGGVVNIITNKTFQGMKIGVQQGRFLSDGDGEGTEVSGLWGGGSANTHIVFGASYYEEGEVTTTDRAQSAFPNPFATSCDVPDSFCSSFTPQGRFILGPNFDFASITLNDGVLNDGGANIPVFNATNPGSGDDFHPFTNADRFNYNGFGFNYLATPNERINLFTNLTHALTSSTDLSLKASYTNRKSSTRAAPEPLCLGAGCGNRIAENILIHRDNPFNPFGVDLSVANGNLEFFGRRPLESGPRIFEQDVDTYFGSATLEGSFTSGSKNYDWDVTASFGENQGFQQKFSSHNIARLAVALGDPAVCAQVPGCVPFNFFGGQGPSGTGSFTQEMLNYVTYTQRDFSEQTQLNLNANITGDLFELPNEAIVGFAAGVEYRDQEGSFQPDPIPARGESAGINSAPTAGAFDVSEAYLELNFPLIVGGGGSGGQYLELNLAGRYSDYSSSGGENSYKLGVLWKPSAELSLRGSTSTGIRAPGIGELFGGAAREDFTFLDPCADVLGVIGSGGGGRDTPQPADIIANCAALGVPVGLAQRNPQLSAVSAGNATLIPETSDAYSFGVVYSPSGAGWSVSVDWYDLQIDDAIQGRNPGEVLTACAETLDPFFCDRIERAASGQVNLIDNQLQNIGTIEASGADIEFGWTGGGPWGVAFSATYLDNYTEITSNPDGSVDVFDRTGTLTDETFQRGFAEWRAMGRVDYQRDHWSTGLTLRWTDDMLLDSGSNLDSILYTDLLVRYDLPYGNESTSLSIGINNLLDEDPSLCDACGVVGMSPFHDLPGTFGYVRLEIGIE
jgi:iron complex outermembrane receptor protein